MCRALAKTRQSTCTTERRQHRPMPRSASESGAVHEYVNLRCLSLPMIGTAKRLCAQKIRLPLPDHFFDCLAVVQFLVEDFLRQHRQFRIARETKRHQLIHAEFGDARTELSWK